MNVTRKDLEENFGTNPEIKYLEAYKDMIEEWIVELKDNL